MKTDDYKTIGLLIRAVGKIIAYIVILVWWHELGKVNPALPWILLLSVS